VKLRSWNNTVPFFIRLREFVKTGFPQPEIFPTQVARMIVGEMPPRWVHHLLDTGRAILLIDGVDELPQSMRSDMLDHLQQLVKAYPYTRYVISSRPAALKSDQWPEWQEWIEQEKFTVSTLQPMSTTQVETFIDHWYQALDKTLSDERERRELSSYSSQLKRVLRQRPPLRRLATTPILCAMICALFRERQQNLPAERIELYRQCVEMLLTYREEGRRIQLTEDYPNLSHAQKLALIQNFAYWLLQNEYSDVEIDEGDQHFEERLQYMMKVKKLFR
jgi:predicted NACHT family NTPase